MKEWMSLNPGMIQRGKNFDQRLFRYNLVRQLARIDDAETPPVAPVAPTRKRKAVDQEGVTDHCPVISPRRTCAVCWNERNEDVKSRYSCAACRNSNGNPVALCIAENRLCFQQYHTAEYRHQNL